MKCPASGPPSPDTLSHQQVIASYRESVRDTIGWLAERPGRTDALAPFDSLFQETWREQELQNAAKPIVGTFCNFVPEELVIAAGAILVRLELGQSALSDAGVRTVPTDCCSQVKAIAGIHDVKLPWAERIDLLVLPTACDGKKKLAQVLAQTHDVALLELPQTKDYVSAAPRWHAQIAQLTKRLQKLTGHKIRRRALRETIELINRRAQLIRHLNQVRWQNPAALSSGDLMLVSQASFFADLKWWVEKAETLVTALTPTTAKSDAKAVPLLLTGSPIFFPDFRLLRLVEEAGGDIVADEICSGTQPLWHPTVLDERTVGGMTRAAADRTLLPATCPCFVAADDRIRRLKELIALSGARGVIHHTQRLCLLYDMEYMQIANALKTDAMPLINIHTEHGQQASATVANRLEAFVEMIQQ